MDILNQLWVEKYRPKKLDDLVVPDEYRQTFINYIEKGEIPHLLFVGPAGSGKSTLARILCSNKGVLKNTVDNLLEINGSAKETKGIGFVNDVIEPFLKIPVFQPDHHRVVFIDEADFLTTDAMHSLRVIIERCSSLGRFIFTGNYISKFPDPLQSRFQDFSFKQIPIDFVLKYCRSILDSEEVEYNDDSESDIRFIIDGLYPDIRRIVNRLQRSIVSNKLKVNKTSIITNEKIIVSSIVELVSLIKAGDKSKTKIGKIIDRIIDITDEEGVDYRSIYIMLFRREEIPPPSKIIINRYSSKHGECLVSSMHFCAMIFDIVESLIRF